MAKTSETVTRIFGHEFESVTIQATKTDAGWIVHTGNKVPVTVRDECYWATEAEAEVALGVLADVWDRNAKTVAARLAAQFGVAVGEGITAIVDVPDGEEGRIRVTGLEGENK